MYQICSDDDEFEPRITPKPAPKFDCFTVPSVPEVSLVFDKPLSYKTTQQKASFQSPVESKNLTSKTNVPSPLNGNGSYAAWKEQNYLWKSPPSKVNDCITPQKVQSNQNRTACYTLAEDHIMDTLNEPKKRSYTQGKDIYNDSQYKQETQHKRSNDCTNKHNYEASEGNMTESGKNQNVKVLYNNKIRQVDFTSDVPHVTKLSKNPDNYIVDENEYPPLYHERKVATQNSEQQKVACYNSVNESIAQNVSVNPNTLQRNEVQLPHYQLPQQYPYFNMNTYPFPQIHPCSPQNMENQETVKNLLQIINSQNEQIKSLQTQVDRLLKMQEEALRERKRCSCLFQSQQKNEQLYTNVKSNNAPGVSNCDTVPESTKKNTYQRESPKKKQKEYRNENENVNQSELILTDTQSKKAFMEQKVSIGVMTSFEFTVQNNPFPVDVEDYEKRESQKTQENLKICSGVGIRDTNESLRRYKNSFTRMPSAQLENIVEDSESYMSSSQQQSSNLNASTSTKDLDKQAYADVRRETDIHRCGSPKLCKASRLNETEDAMKKHSERPIEEVRNCTTVKTPMIQRHPVSTEYNVTENRNFKVNPRTNMDQYKNSNIQRGNDSAKASNSVSNSDYYKDYRKEGQTSGSKRTNCIEDSLILNGGDLKINERPPPTPEPSIHVEMNEYSSDDDSEKVKRSSKVGWTFYNNVLGQVNQLLQNSCVIEDQQQNQMKVNQNEQDETENRAVLDTVKVATLEQLKKLGISLSENPEAKEQNNGNKMAFDLSFYPRLDYQANMTQATSAVNETNTSMHMKALALKYLSDEQLAELAVQRQGSTSVKHLMVSNVQGTNMSFATMRYLERYQLLPGKNNVQTEDIDKIPAEVSPKVDLKFANLKNSPKKLQRFPFNQTPRTTCPSKILDISTLKQQPKLL